jgi:hypothetical protein
MLLELFPDPRHAEEEGRRDLPDVAGHRVDGLGEVHPPARDEVQHRRVRSLGHVAQRQIADRLEGLSGHTARGGVGIGAIDEVAVREHRALRRTGRARGVDEDVDVIGHQGGDGSVQPSVGLRVFSHQLVPQVKQVLEAVGPALLVTAQALHVHAEHMLQLGQARAVGARIQQLVGLLLVAGNCHLGLAVVGDVLHLRPRVGRVDADHLHADHLRTQVRVEPGWHVLGSDDDAVAFLQPQLPKPERRAARVPPVVGPGAGRPDAVDLLAQRDLVGPLGCVNAQHRGQRGLAAQEHVMRQHVLSHARPPHLDRLPAPSCWPPPRPACPRRSASRSPARRCGPTGPSPLSCHVRSSAPPRRTRRGCPA